MTALRTLVTLLGLSSVGRRCDGWGSGALRPRGHFAHGRTPQRHEFDLTTALRRARREHKRLYIYLGAERLPPIAASTRPSLQATRSSWRRTSPRTTSSSTCAAACRCRPTDSTSASATRSLPYADFQRSIGDERARLLVYPSVWLLDANAKPLMQMPAGTGTFETVPEQLEILRLEQ